EIERLCLKYLSESSNPLVPIDTLLRFIQRKDEFLDLDEAILTDFLRKHDLFRVIEPLPIETDPEGARELAEAGFIPKARAILCTRIPTAADVRANMLVELDRMDEALEAALEDAKSAQDREKARAIRRLLSRTAQLRERIEKAIR